jgi:hypothetical protein
VGRMLQVAVVPSLFARGMQGLAAVLSPAPKKAAVARLLGTTTQPHSMWLGAAYLHG